jgi:enolase
MSVDTSITFVDAREILDLRGNPTIEVDVSSPIRVDRSAAIHRHSTGVHEAVELRDGRRSASAGRASGRPSAT